MDGRAWGGLGRGLRRFTAAHGWPAHTARLASALHPYCYDARSRPDALALGGRGHAAKRTQR
ncbi:hypothetical protein [Streptomyces sp. DHE17-7]|uniref:hypothetical protein n=1 Tax=Streptomyces sp. DHE17-7 TaxID=2759949 RepID=UPI0022EBA1DB|nr:hypothetical protein [Streptomyces sp. DHE17-7]MBJ6623433.1 hypothetical protein [Streptomyces sp. DHE17-7]